MKETKLTTVKILSELYNNFKKETIENEFTLQKLVNRSMFLYVNDKNGYKESIQNVTVETSIDGVNFLASSRPMAAYEKANLLKANIIFL